MIKFDIEPSPNQQIGPDRVGQMYHYTEDMPWSLVVERDINAVNNALNALDTLDNLRDTITENTGDLDPTQQKLTQITMESIRRSLGLEALPVISLESVSTRQIALEGVGSLILSVWMAIINTIRKIFAAIANLFKSKRQRDAEARFEQTFKGFDFKFDVEGRFPEPRDLTGGVLRSFRHLDQPMRIDDVRKMMTDCTMSLLVLTQICKSLDSETTKFPDLIRKNINEQNSYSPLTIRLHFMTTSSAIATGFKKIQRFSEYDEFHDLHEYDVKSLEGFANGDAPGAIILSSTQTFIGADLIDLHRKRTNETGAEKLTVVSTSEILDLKSVYKTLHDHHEGFLDAFEKMSKTSIGSDGHLRKLELLASAKQDNPESAAWNKGAQKAYREIIRAITHFQSYVQLSMRTFDSCTSLVEGLQELAKKK